MPSQTTETITLLGDTLISPKLKEGKTLNQYKSARKSYFKNLNDPESLIWYGRRTAYLGYYLGLRNIDSHMLQTSEWVVLLHLLFGMFLSCSGACVFNQYFERDIDAKMDRTKKRPLPLEKIKPINAYFFGLFLFLFEGDLSL